MDLGAGPLAPRGAAVRRVRLGAKGEEGVAERWSRRGFAAAVGGALLAGTAGGAAASASKAGARVTVRLNGKTVTLVEPPLVASGTVYLSAADLAQVLGLPVTWDAHTGLLDIGQAPASAKSTFAFQGISYAAVGLQIRTYPGPQNSSASYWIVQYTATNTGKQPVDMTTGQPELMLIGPTGSEYTPDSTLSGPQASTINPGLTFASYMVFDVPPSAIPAQYALGFNAYRVTASGFTTSRLSAALPPATGHTERETINAPYTLSGLWNSEVQDLLIRAVVRTNQVVPDLTPSNFDPTTSFWVVQFGVDNPGPSTISFSAADFALTLGGSLSIAPYTVTSLPGYISPSNIQTGVTLAAGQVFNGALFFVVPGGTPTSSPQLVVAVNGAQESVSAAPCPDGACPPVQG